MTLFSILSSYFSNNNNVDANDALLHSPLNNNKINRLPKTPVTYTRANVAPQAVGFDRLCTFLSLYTRLSNEKNSEPSVTKTREIRK